MNGKIVVRNDINFINWNKNYEAEIVQKEKREKYTNERDFRKYFTSSSKALYFLYWELRYVRENLRRYHGHLSSIDEKISLHVTIKNHSVPSLIQWLSYCRYYYLYVTTYNYDNVHKAGDISYMYKWSAYCALGKAEPVVIRGEQSTNQNVSDK